MRTLTSTWKPARLALAVALSAALASPVLTTADDELPDEAIDISDFPGTFVDEVVVPVASEVFAVLDKLGNPNWKGQLRGVTETNHKDRTVLSLHFGSVVAEGFIAVQAEDKDATEEIGREVLKLAEALGIRDAVLKHYQSILDAADKEDWNAIRRELDRTQRTVRETMKKMRDNELAQLVSIGGWLRGTEVVTSIIGAGYSEDRAELLNQPDLVKHFREAVGKMDPKVRDHKLVKRVASGLEVIEKQMVKGGEAMPAPGVKEIQGVCATLIKELNTAN